MTVKLAINGGDPVRKKPLAYGRQSIDDADIAAVVDVLKSDWLTTGPHVDALEQAFAAATGAAHAVAVANGTAALHCAMHAAGVGPGDEVIVPPLTFAATANAVLYCGGTPVFADVDASTLLLDPDRARERITPRTKAICAVDYAGQAAESARFRALAREHGLTYVADACHALGGRDGERVVGTHADLATFSLHPVKPITSGEGGVITTHDAEMARRMRVFRNHGITTDHRQREKLGAFHYEMVELGFNYRLTDIQSALATSQLRRLPQFVERRIALAKELDAGLRGVRGVTPLGRRPDVVHAFHLYVVRLDARLHPDRARFVSALRAEGILANVHYPPVHLHPYYREKLGHRPGECPVAEDAAAQIVTLPLFVGMSSDDVADVVTAVRKVAEA